MNYINEVVFSGTGSGYGAWFNVGHASGWTLQVIGIENDATLQIYLSDELVQPLPFVANPNAVLSYSTPPYLPQPFILDPGNPCPIRNWIQVQKIAGTAPVPTSINLFAQIPS